MIPKSKERIAWDEDRDVFRRIKIKAAAEAVTVASVGRALFKAWLADDPRIRAVLAGAHETPPVMAEPAAKPARRRARSAAG